MIRSSLSQGWAKNAKLLTCIIEDVGVIAFSRIQSLLVFRYKMQPFRNISGR